MNINDLGKLLGKPPITAPKPITKRVDMDACARIAAMTQAPVIRTCPVCRIPHPSDIACKPGEARDNGPTLTRRDDI